MPPFDPVEHIEAIERFATDKMSVFDFIELLKKSECESVLEDVVIAQLESVMGIGGTYYMMIKDKALLTKCLDG